MIDEFRSRSVSHREALKPWALGDPFWWIRAIMMSMTFMVLSMLWRFSA